MDYLQKEHGLAWLGAKQGELPSGRGFPLSIAGKNGVNHLTRLLG